MDYCKTKGVCKKSKKIVDYISVNKASPFFIFIIIVINKRNIINTPDIITQ